MKDPMINDAHSILIRRGEPYRNILNPLFKIYLQSFSFVVVFFFFLHDDTSKEHIYNNINKRSSDLGESPKSKGKVY